MEIWGSLKKTREEVLTNEILTSRVTDEVSSFIIQKDNVLSTFFPKKKSELQSKLFNYCKEDEGVSKIDLMMDLGMDAFEKLKTTSYKDLLKNPLVQQCIKRNMEVRDNAFVESRY